MSGYVFGTLYRRIRKSSSNQDFTNVQYLRLISAGKSTSPLSGTDTEILVDTKNLGGLWKVKEEVVEMFEVAEKYFRIHVVNSPYKRNYDCKELVSVIIKDSNVLSNFSVLRSMATEKVDKEMSLNLLYDLFTLYIRLRTFSFVKQKKEKFRIETKKMKMDSLRKSIKKSSSSLEMGH